VYNNDTYTDGIAFPNLAQMWQVSIDKDLPAVIASILGSTVQEVETVLREMFKDESGEAGDE
jgi:hypothetical protein